MGFRSLRVLNEDLVVPGAGFPEHSHEDMEIVTIVLRGRVAHKDSLGNEAVVTAGEVQRMSAGTGVTHSEMNPSADERAHVLQLWIIPDKFSVAPSYEQKSFPPSERRNQLITVASPDGRGGSVRLHKDALLELARLDEGHSLNRGLRDGRGYWVQVAAGVIGLNGTEMREGDGAAVEDEDVLAIEAETDAEILIVDLP
jgi:redox-sensitive bicupin YhaK (pirin superfamily)